MHFDNEATIFIVRNCTLHERMKHIEINCHYIQDKAMSGVISNPHVASSHQLADIFMESLAGISYDATCTKLGMFDLYDPT